MPAFTPNVDVESGGVLFALPFLLSNGLLKYADQFFTLTKGYYGLKSLLIILVFMALLRIKSLEGVRYCNPGELGKLVGLDRIPEVRTLRVKVKQLAENGDPYEWSKQLAKLWMENEPNLSETFYVDGHIRVYNGKQTNLPKRYVSREKLCLSGVTDYWVNDGVGQPFFVVTKTVNSGLLTVLRDEIIPRLLKDIPNQPTKEELKSNPYLFRFALVFDREGYSPSFFKEMWEERIACYTYRKYVKEDWHESEFEEQEVIFPNGEIAKMKLAERGVYFKEEKFWVREIRKLNDSGHQTALITTDYYNDSPKMGSNMFARWCQENFFKYMIEHYEIDRLIEYEVEKMDETVRMVNPKYRELEKQINSKNTKFRKEQAKYGALLIKGKKKESKKYLKKKSELEKSLETLEKELHVLKIQKKETDNHILFSELPEAEQFDNLKKSGKQFINVIKMIAYRTETAMANILRDYMPKKDEVRTLVRQIFMTDADIKPDEKQGLLKVQIHNMTNPRNNQYVQKLCDVLNESGTLFPGTALRLVYELVSSQNHGDQEF